MKTTVNKVKRNDPKIKFPCLMINPITETIILATGKDDDDYYLGFIVSATEPTTYKTGDNSSCGKWSRDFEFFDGSVTLSND